ncbi:hypothetical protein B0W47_01615 [Komagataeibacter nataicola]|uniref:Sulfotransferase family protein n=3 Tax=Komagataeibacter nataicola TaxID=265960 RepID=A0A9N7CJJ3_9PROT|nr:hypothetical protein B0W47_01615 [Komagataeibacter nataicola]PYD66603.1 hypothetical protein CDI09_07770 [Komagataeibacter nataicola]GBR18790.1 hypothetical protein AA0616_1381 [Komagataeibacter nataicola NRIC 0616]
MQTLLQPVLRVKMSSDVHERLSELHIAYPPGPKRQRRAAMVRARGLLFIHVPKNAGTSITRALYGMDVGHETIRYFQRRLPDLVRFPSFAILRDPVQRFLSAYRYARAGGSGARQVAQGFRAHYMALRDLDDALDLVAQARNPYHIDHIFRPQTWYLTGHDGIIAVNRLFMLDEMARIERFIAPFGSGPITHVNATAAGEKGELPSPDQIRRIRRIYRADYDLIARTRQAR